MIAYLRRLPGPVWTMLLACGLFALNRITGGLRSDGNLASWLPMVLFQFLIIGVLLACGQRSPLWLLKTIVFAQLAVSFLLLLLTDDPLREFAIAAGTIVGVLYVGIWLRGWLTYVVAGIASLSYLVAIVWAGNLNELLDTWFGLTSMLFGVSFVLNTVVGRASYDAQHDGLTGFRNRIGLDAYLELHARPGRASLPRTLVVIDLDGFKAINDAQGHAAGDEVLRSTAAAWRAALRPDDVAVRIGGDEFLLILPQTDLGGAEELAARLRAVSPISWSCGIGAWPADEGFDEVLVRADRLMYDEKANRGAAS